MKAMAETINGDLAQEEVSELISQLMFVSDLNPVLIMERLDELEE